LNRLLGIIVTGVWLVAMTALVRRDLLPYWLADDPPAAVMIAHQSQMGVTDSAGRRIGAIWVRTSTGPQLATVRSTTYLEPRALAQQLLHINRILIESDLTYERDGTLYEFAIAVFGAGIPIRIKGERLGTDFAVSATAGDLKTMLALDGETFQHLGETIRPFGRLGRLSVGLRWRVRVLDPFSALTGGAPRFYTHLSTVTRRETLDIDGEAIECFRIELPGAIAWSDARGDIVRQEVQTPLLGRWIMTREPFDELAMKVSVAAVKSLALEIDTEAATNDAPPGADGRARPGR